MQRLRRAKQFFRHFKLVTLRHFKLLAIKSFRWISWDILNCSLMKRLRRAKHLSAEKFETIFSKNLRHDKHLVLLRHFKLHQYEINLLSRKYWDKTNSVLTDGKVENYTHGDISNRLQFDHSDELTETFQIVHWGKIWDVPNIFFAETFQTSFLLRHLKLLTNEKIETEQTFFLSMQT